MVLIDNLADTSAASMLAGYASFESVLLSCQRSKLGPSPVHP